jgi:hypothetical protein
MWITPIPSTTNTRRFFSLARYRRFGLLPREQPCPPFNQAARPYQQKTLSICK